MVLNFVLRSSAHGCSISLFDVPPCAQGFNVLPVLSTIPQLVTPKIGWVRGAEVMPCLLPSR